MTRLACATFTLTVSASADMMAAFCLDGRRLVCVLAGRAIRWETALPACMYKEVSEGGPHS